LLPVVTSDHQPMLRCTAFRSAVDGNDVVSHAQQPCTRRSSGALMTSTRRVSALLLGEVRGVFLRQPVESESPPQLKLRGSTRRSSRPHRVARPASSVSLSVRHLEALRPRRFETSRIEKRELGGCSARWCRNFAAAVR
jgi:hypothetical protein